LLNDLNKQIESTRRSVEASFRAEPARLKKSVANRAASTINSLRGTLRTWFGYYNAYDPLFTWWVDEPYKAVDQTLGSYATFMTERVLGLRTGDSAPTLAQGPPQPGQGGGRSGGTGAGGGGGGRQGLARPGDSSDIIGDPIGREAC
jgi:hypothetical protein